MTKLEAIKTRDELKKVEANIRWLVETDRFDRVGELEEVRDRLKAKLEDFKV